MSQFNSFQITGLLSRFASSMLTCNLNQPITMQGKFMKWALMVRKCAPAIAIYNLYRPINLRAENQISQLHSRQISAAGDTQITIIGYPLNFDWLRMWRV